MKSMTSAFILSVIILAGAAASGLAAEKTTPEPKKQQRNPLVKYISYRLGKNATSLEAIRTEGLVELCEKQGMVPFSGPMLGCVTDSGAKFWVRTIREVNIQVVVGSGPDLKEAVRSRPVKTSAALDLTAVAEVRGLKPFTVYHYDVLVDGKSALKPKLPSFRTYPGRKQKAEFSVGFGGGARNAPGKERIWDTIAGRSPLAFLFLGDNVYIDQPTLPGYQRRFYYLRQLEPSFRRLSAGTSIYAIWDDHDFGKNDCEGGPETFKPDWKLPVWKVFRENWNNPYYGGGEKQPGCWFDFSIGDVDFFMTDGRYYRSRKNKTMLGPVQKKWLLEKLKASKGTFKVLCSGTLWTEHADKGGRDSWWGFKEEREEILSLIDREKIGGVILLSADRHRTDVYKIERPNGYTLYEFETSKLTNTHTHGTNSKALFSYNKGNFFGLLTFDLEKADPEVTFRCVTIDGEPVYELTLKRSQLGSR
jgi:alkaline phosphatase D